ncbi:MAG TPA: 2'-5' RNA ligase family protein [Flavobacteriales bacterium]|jgi:hypothetical protein|nr:2'-5' RNA ligase family protein [Flavobacteriales bacterium]
MARKSTPDALSLFDTLVYTCQYRLVIDPASTAMARVMEWRQALRERIGTFDGAFQMPGIVLFGTELPPDYERALSDAIERGCEGHGTFALSIHGLAHTEDKKTIYLDVLEKEPIAALRQRIVDHVRANRRIKKLGVEVSERPMLPVASGLSAEKFAAAWALLSPFSFTTQQRVSDVVLMKRELDKISLDEHVRTFALQAAR